MDLLALLSTLWRHRVAALLVVLLTAGGAAGVLYVKPPPWSGTTSYLLVEPPAAPTADQVEADPSLKEIKSDNPFTRYGTTSVIIDVVGRRVATKAVQTAVVADGGSPVFEVVPSTRYGTASPIIDITSTADSKEAVLASLRTLGTQVAAQLAAIQAEDAVDPTYTYTLRQIDDPEQLTRKISNTLRLLVGVAALGMLSLLVVLGGLEGRVRRRRARDEPTDAEPEEWLEPDVAPEPALAPKAAADVVRRPRRERAARPVPAAAPARPATISLLSALLEEEDPEETSGPADDEYDFGFVDEFDAVTSLDLGPDFWLAHDRPGGSERRTPQLQSRRGPQAPAVVRARATNASTR